MCNMTVYATKAASPGPVTLLTTICYKQGAPPALRWAVNDDETGFGSLSRDATGKPLHCPGGTSCL